ncbi:6312_t:CDS:2 [Cetraspora pellucida]|uniref:6312_t:CDS:1 n=1 Tax=Cetraspora pellucida TaxID=1433469 RepID=A0A9N9C473_9GLOM|nr:6312_t:CDS:2 [Cetraspora pellucida]
MDKLYITRIKLDKSTQKKIPDNRRIQPDYTLLENGFENMVLYKRMHFICY